MHFYYAHKYAIVFDAAKQEDQRGDQTLKYQKKVVISAHIEQQQPYTD